MDKNRYKKYKKFVPSVQIDYELSHEILFVNTKVMQIITIVSFDSFQCGIFQNESDS